MDGEDFEFCYRVKKAGFSVIFSPLTRVVHLGRGSVDRANINAITGEFKGIIYFYKKFKRMPARFVARSLLKFGAILRIVIFGILLLRRELLKAYFKAVFV